MQGGIAVNRRASGRFQALIRISAQNGGDMRGWFHLVSAIRAETKRPHAGHSRKAAEGIRTLDLLHGKQTL
jgi:hypothetical protein